LKYKQLDLQDNHSYRRMWSGFSSEIEIARAWIADARQGRRMWSGFSSEIEIPIMDMFEDSFNMSHVERLLI